MTDPQLELDLVRFADDGRQTAFSLDLAAETIWATASEIADLFRTPAATVARHIATLYAEGELDMTTTRRMLPALADGKAGKGAPVDHYDLDVILSVGYRVNAAKATALRRWASRILRRLLIEGFVLDGARLSQDGAARNALADKLRAIRADETNVYESVRQAFAAGAADFDAASPDAHSFAKLLDDKFVFAVTGKSAPALVLERADHDAPDMGLKHFEGSLPSMDEARIAQNYLEAHELYLTHILCEQFLLLIQQEAARGRTMTMARLTAALDDLLRANDYPVLPHHKEVQAGRAIRHAQAEYARFVLGAQRSIQSKASSRSLK